MWLIPPGAGLMCSMPLRKATAENPLPTCTRHTLASLGIFVNAWKEFIILPFSRNTWPAQANWPTEKDITQDLNHVSLGQLQHNFRQFRIIRVFLDLH